MNNSFPLINESLYYKRILTSFSVIFRGQILVLHTFSITFYNYIFLKQKITKLVFDFFSIYIYNKLY